MCIRDRYLGEAYSLGEEYYTEIGDSVAVEEIDNMNYYIFSLVMDSLEKKDFQKYEEIHLSEKYKKGRQWCLDFFEKIYEKVGTEFEDVYKRQHLPRFQQGNRNTGILAPLDPPTGSSLPVRHKTGK